MANTKVLYHLSKTPIELLTPRVPKSEFEDQTTPRICFSDSIEGCLIGINENKDITGERFKVYAIETSDYYTPTLSEVPDRAITGEVWVQFAVEPEFLYDIEVVGMGKTHMEEINGNYFEVPSWEYKIIEENKLTEDTRTLLVSKSRSAGPYKNSMRGKNRFERKKHSHIAKTVKQYNKIDMNKLFKEDILEVTIPVTGETDSYSVNIRMEKVVEEIARNIKSNKNKLEFRTIVQSLTKVFNTSNIYVKCSCPDYKYRFAHWNIVNNVSIDDSSKDPGPGKGIRNPDDKLGRGCKHVLLVLANGDWVMKVASVINNYVHYAEKKLQKPFLKLIFPKLYGVPADEMVEQDLIDDEKFLDSSEGLIDAINEYGKNRGKYTPGTNKNPVTGTGGRTKADKAADEKDSNKEQSKAPEGAAEAAKKEPQPEMPDEEIEETDSKKPAEKPAPEEAKKPAEANKQAADEENKKDA